MSAIFSSQMNPQASLPKVDSVGFSLVLDEENLRFTAMIRIIECIKYGIMLCGVKSKALLATPTRPRCVSARGRQDSAVWTDI